MKNKYNITSQLLVFLILIPLITTSCIEEDEIESQVITEEIIYVSAETVRVIGRILSLSSENITDHGFLIDSIESFPNPITIELGASSKLGRYIGETNQLQLNKPYFCKSFITENGQTIYGNVLLFNSLPPFLTEFHPKYANIGDVVEIDGANFTKDTQVFFGEIEAEVEQIDFESKLIVRVPNADSNFNVKISVLVKDESIEFTEDFEYVTGKWTKEAEFFNTEQYEETLAMRSGENLYFGLGKDENGQLNPNMWILDLNNYTWSSSDLLTNSRYPFSVDSYFGGGAISFLPKTNITDFWYFDGISFISKSSTPFTLYKSLALATTDNVIVFGGLNEDGSDNMLIYEYSKVADEWSEFGVTPFSIRGPLPHFNYNDNLYVVNKIDNAIWEYNTLENIWNHFIDLPEEGLNGGISGVINDKVYVGLFDLDNRIWELDMDEISWKDKISYSGSRGDANNGTFLYENKIFLLKNKFTSSARDNMPMELWSFDADDL